MGGREGRGGGVWRRVGGLSAYSSVEQVPQYKCWLSQKAWSTSADKCHFENKYLVKTTLSSPWKIALDQSMTLQKLLPEQ